MGKSKLQLLEKQQKNDQDNKDNKQKEQEPQTYRVENKFDPYEIRDCFNTFITDKLAEQPDIKEKHTYENSKILIGILITIIVVASHFVPIPWPQTYYFIIGCIVSYYIVAYKYGQIEQERESTCFYLFEFEGKTYRFCSDMEDYKLEMLFSIQWVKDTKKHVHETLYETKLQVPEYVDKRGYLCEHKLFSTVNQWLEKASSSLAKKSQ